MIYRTNPKNGDKISQLAFGCMRLPRSQEKTNELVKTAIDSGINYFDTAYIYPGSERALGTALKATGLRNKIKIATKLPLFSCKTSESMENLFNTQKNRLGVDSIDYYLLHMLCDMQTLERLRSIGLDDWVKRKKESGEIVNIGFSFHGERNNFSGLIDAFDWDFCMIQYNYCDENNQAGRHGLNYATEKGIPVMVMSPLRGGLLSHSLAKEAKDVFAKASMGAIGQPGADGRSGAIGGSGGIGVSGAIGRRSLSEWSLRWLWDQPEVLTVLSGMSDMKQLDENIAAASIAEVGCVSTGERKVYQHILEIIKQSQEIPCTSCGYCLPCPYGVNIPDCFSIYNERGNFFETIKRYLMATGAVTAKQSYASLCVQCKVCEKSCPQKIEISTELSKVARKIESFWFRPVFAIVRKFMGVR